MYKMARIDVSKASMNKINGWVATELANLKVNLKYIPFTEESAYRSGVPMCGGCNTNMYIFYRGLPFYAFNKGCKYCEARKAIREENRELC